MDGHTKMSNSINKIEKNFKRKQKYNGSNKKIDFAMLHLLETLTLISTSKNKQMEKIKTSLASIQKTHPSNPNNPLWNNLSKKNSETQNQVRDLSIKVDQCLKNSESKKEDKKSTDSSNIKVIRPLLQVVDGVVKVTHHLAMKIANYSGIE